MKDLNKYNTALNLSKLSESEYEQIFNLLSSKSVCESLKWKLRNKKLYLNRMKTFKIFNDVYLFKWSDGNKKYTTDVYYVPNARILIDFQTFKQIHFTR